MREIVKRETIEIRVGGRSKPVLRCRGRAGAESMSVRAGGYGEWEGGVLPCGGLFIACPCCGRPDRCVSLGQGGGDWEGRGALTAC